MFKIGVVGKPGGWSSERLADVIFQRTGYKLLIDMKDTYVDFSKKTVFYNNIDLLNLDALIIKKVGSRYSPDLLDRLEILRFLNETGLKMFSKPIHILRVLDRLSCTVTLQSAGIPMPPTIITENPQEALKAVELFGEAVFKPLYSSKARGMEVIRWDSEAKDKILEFKKKNNFLYIQKKIDLKGIDLGVVFLEGKYIKTFARRINENSWNTTTRSGGTYEPYTPSEQTIIIAKKAQDLFKLDFTSVDVVETSKGAMVFEVSAFGGFQGIYTAYGIDAASLYIDYVLNILKSYR